MSEFVIEIALFIGLYLTERMEILYQRCTMVPAVVTSANTLQSKIDHPEKYEKCYIEYHVVVTYIQ